MGDNSANKPPVASDGISRTGMKGAERSARYRARFRRLGIVQVNVLVPAHAAPDLLLLAEALRAATHLTLGPLRDPISGRLVAAKSVLRNRKAVA